MYAIRGTYWPREGTFFDHDYYRKNHIRLARELLKDRVNYRSMHAEFDQRVLMDGGAELRSPCIFVLVVDSESDVEAFRNFRRAPHALPLREDAKIYTNCVLEWTVAEIVEE